MSVGGSERMKLSIHSPHTVCGIQCTAMFNSSLVYELGILRNYAMPLLLKIDNYQPEYSEAKRLYRLLSYFEPINPKHIPNQSLLREFIGGSVFEE